MLSQTHFPFPPLISDIDNQPSYASEIEKLAMPAPSQPVELSSKTGCPRRSPVKPDRRSEFTSGAVTSAQNTPSTAISCRFQEGLSTPAPQA
jgi:hypothetical protein